MPAFELIRYQSNVRVQSKRTEQEDVVIVKFNRADP